MTPQKESIWEWRKVKQSFGDKKRNERINDLQYWNSGLKAIVDKAEIPFPDEDANSPVKKILARLGAQHCEKIRDGLGFVYQAFQKTGWTCQCTEHRAVIRLRWHTEKEKTSAGGDFGFGFAGLRAAPSWEPILANIEEREQEKLMPSTPTRSPSPSKPESKKLFPGLSIRWKKQQGSSRDTDAQPSSKLTRFCYT